MNVRLLKAKRVERNVKQKDLAIVLGITEKAMCQKECSELRRWLKSSRHLTYHFQNSMQFFLITSLPKV